MTQQEHQQHITQAVSQLADDYAAVNFSAIRFSQAQVEEAARALGLRTFRRAGSEWLRGRRTAVQQDRPRFQRRPEAKDAA